MKDKKSDNSVYIPQKPKFHGEIEIRNFEWTEKQQRLINTVIDNNAKIVFIKAPSGVGKTLIATYIALKKLSSKKIGEVLFVRNPIESASKGIGFLVGDKKQKMEVYGLPLFDQLRELISKQTIDSLIKEERIQIEALGFIKGRTLHNYVIIADESEDLSVMELRLLMSRLGKTSTLFIIGDINQTNIKNSGFEEVFRAFSNEEAIKNGIYTFEFQNEDSMRCSLIKYILDKFDAIQKNMFTQ